MRHTGLGLLVTLALLLASCTLAPRDASLAIYARNQSTDALGFRLDYVPGGQWSRLEGISSGCSDVRLPWTISIGAAGRDGQVGDYHQLLASANVADPNQAQIWIDVAEDGSVSWGEGRPAWDEVGPLGCGLSN
jgi:hypothetical protein